MRLNLLHASVSTCLALALLGCPKRVGSQSELDPTAREKLEAAKQQASSGNPQEALKLLEQVPDKESREVGEVLFEVAEKQLQARDFAGARSSYRELLARFPLFDKADLAKYHLGLAQLELKEYRDALQTLTPLYGRLSDAQRPEAATKLALAAEGARNWVEAVRWRAEALRQAKTIEDQTAEQQRIVELLESRVAFVDVARLAEETPVESPVWPLLHFKLARIFSHLRDQTRLKETLQALLEKAPNSPYASDARAMMERLEKRTAPKPDTVGLALPLSGKFKSFGESVLAGVKLALANSPVKIVTRDTAGDPAQARQAVTALAEDDQVIAIIGPVLSAESEDAAAEAEMEETPIVTLTRAEGITGEGPYVFRNMLTNSAQARALADYATRVRGLKKFAVLYPNIAYGTELANQFWDSLDKTQGTEVNGAESYDADQTTFAPIVQKLVGRYYLDQREEFVAKKKEIIDAVKDPFRQRKLLEDARKKLEPIIDFEALFIPDYFKNIGLVAPALAVEDVITNACDKRDLERIAKTTGKKPEEIKSVQVFGANGWNFPELVERGGKFVQCAIFVDGFFVNSDRKETRSFVDAFRKATGRDPGLLEASGYDTARILRTVIEGQRPQNRAALREALLKVKDFPGATGKTSFNKDREGEKPLFFLTIDRDEIRELDSEAKS